jgi:hypothetical protein
MGYSWSTSEPTDIKQIYIRIKTENSENFRFYSVRNIIMHILRLDTDI